MKVDWEFIAQHPIEDKMDYMHLALNLCCCGSGQDFDLLLEVLRWSASGEDRFKKNGTGYDEGVYQSVAHELAMKVLDAHGLTEHGSGIGWAWATEDGRKLLKRET